MRKNLYIAREAGAIVDWTVRPEIAEKIKNTGREVEERKVKILDLFDFCIIVEDINTKEKIALTFSNLIRIYPPQTTLQEIYKDWDYKSLLDFAQKTGITKGGQNETRSYR